MSHGERGPDGRLVPSSRPLMSKREANQRYYLNGGKERQAASKARYLATDKGRRMLRSQNLRQYGMTPEEYDAMLAQQGGGCALCGAEKGHNGTSLAVDHCHRTGKIRGLLCTKCNTALGHFGDDAYGLRRVLAYIEREQ